MHTASEKRLVGHVSGLDSGTVVFDVCQVTGECALWRLTVRSAQAELWREGALPARIGERLVFRVWPSGPGSASRLVAVPLDGVEEEVVVDSVGMSRVSPPRADWVGTAPGAPVGLGGAIMVFEQSDGVVWRYDLETGERRALSLRWCSPIAWRVASRELICNDVQARAIVATSLEANGSPTEQRVLSTGISGVVAYSEEADALYFTRPAMRWGGETAALLRHDLSSGRQCVVIKDVWLSHLTAL